MTLKSAQGMTHLALVDNQDNATVLQELTGIPKRVAVKFVRHLPGTFLM